MPPTTALRWVQFLEQKKLIVRSKDKRDARRAFLALTESGEAMMTNYLTAVQSRMSASDHSMDEDRKPPTA